MRSLWCRVGHGLWCGKGGWPGLGQTTGPVSKKEENYHPRPTDCGQLTFAVGNTITMAAFLTNFLPKHPQTRAVRTPEPKTS